LSSCGGRFSAEVAPQTKSQGPANSLRAASGISGVIRGGLFLAPSLEQLNLDPALVLAIEDSGNGVAAARDAGLAVLVTRSASSAKEPGSAFDDAAAQLNHLGEPQQPCAVLAGPACPEGLVTLSYLQQLLPRG